MTKEKAEKIAKEAGFSHWGFFEVSGLNFLPEVRAMCADGRCHMYNKSWACPPACGTIEESINKTAPFKWGVLLQSTGNMEDDFDVDVMLGTGTEHKKRLNKFISLIDKKEEFFPMGAGGCTICESCTYPDSPCQFPEKMITSMEAYGLVVSEVCQLANVPYYYGPLTMTYTGCVLFKA